MFVCYTFCFLCFRCRRVIVFETIRISYNIYTLVHVTKYSTLYTRERKKTYTHTIWMLLKWTAAKSTLASFRSNSPNTQQPNWSFQLHSIQRFNTLYVLCAHFVCHLNFYGFFFLLSSILLYAFTYTTGFIKRWNNFMSIICFSSPFYKYRGLFEFADIS